MNGRLLRRLRWLSDSYPMIGKLKMLVGGNFGHVAGKAVGISGGMCAIGGSLVLLIVACQAGFGMNFPVANRGTMRVVTGRAIEPGGLAIFQSHIRLIDKTRAQRQPDRSEAGDRFIIRGDRISDFRRAPMAFTASIDGFERC